MSRILITGENSYLAKSIDRYLCEYNSAHGRELYHVDRISLRDESWKNTDFSSYDTLIHMVGMAHADVGHVSDEVKKKYYEINCELACETARKAKNDGVKQFIYMSSIIVYGESAKAGEQKIITESTVPSPANFYGDSKLKAEKGLESLRDSNFNIAIVRSPMVYGRGSRGNYPFLVKIADKTPVFPKINNERSMIYVENLAEFMRILIDRGIGGVFFPQNGEYASTCEIVEAIGRVKGRKILILSFLNPFVMLASRVPGKMGGLINKAFGSFTIDKGLSVRDIDGYQIYSLEESIRKTHEN